MSRTRKVLVQFSAVIIGGEVGIPDGALMIVDTKAESFGLANIL